MNTGEEKRLRGRRSHKVSNGTRETILNSATLLFCYRSYEGVSIRQVSQHAGVSHAAVLHHFNSKQELWQEVGDYLCSYNTALSKLLLERSQIGKSHAHRLYLFSVYLITQMLNFPYSVRYWSEALRVSQEQQKPIFCLNEVYKQVEIQLLSYSEPSSPSLEELKWLVISGCLSAVEVATYQFEKAKDGFHAEGHMHQFLQAFDKLIAKQCGINNEERISSETISELLLNPDHPLTTLSLLPRSERNK